MPSRSRSSTTTEFERKSGPAWAVHPGEVLREDFMHPLGLSSYGLAKALLIPVPRLHDVVLERRGISPDTAIRLARYFGTSEQLWMNLQTAYDLHCARRKAKRDVQKIKPRGHEVA
jgi:antitoxin HigA-1